jgi:hypothetical protein
MQPEDVNEGIKNIKLHMDLAGASFLKRYDWSQRATILDTSLLTYLKKERFEMKLCIIMMSSSM